MQCDCKTCGCSLFEANNFQPNLCTNCLHNHQTPPPAVNRQVTFKPNYHLELGYEEISSNNQNLYPQNNQNYYYPNPAPNATPEYTSNPYYQSFTNTYTLPHAPLPRPPAQNIQSDVQLPPLPPKPHGPLPQIHGRTESVPPPMNNAYEEVNVEHNANTNILPHDLVLPSRPPPIPNRPRSVVMTAPGQSFNPLENFVPIENVTQSPPPELVKRPLPPIPNSNNNSPLPPQITTGRSRRERKKKISQSSREPRNRKKEEKEVEKEKGKEKGMSLTSLISRTVKAVTGEKEETKAMQIMGPTDFQHHGHMGFSESGIEAYNLPPDWQQLFNNLDSTLKEMGVEGLTKEEAKMILTGKVSLLDTPTEKNSTKSQSTALPETTDHSNSSVLSETADRLSSSGWVSQVQVPRQRKPPLIGIGGNTVIGRRVSKNTEDNDGDIDDEDENISQDRGYDGKDTTDTNDNENIQIDENDNENPDINHNTENPQVEDENGENVPVVPEIKSHLLPSQSRRVYRIRELKIEDFEFLQNEIKDLKASVLSLTKDLAGKDSIISRLELDKDKYQTQFTKKSEEIVQLKQSLSANISELEELKKLITELKDELDLGKQEKENLIASHQEFKDHLVAKHAEEIQQLKHAHSIELQNLVNFNNENSKTREEFEVANRQLTIEIGVLKSKMNAATRAIEEKDSIIKNYEDEISSVRKLQTDSQLQYQSKLESSNKEYQILNDKIRQLEEENSQLQDTNNQSLLKLKQNEDLLAQLNSKISNNENSLQIELNYTKSSLQTETNNRMLLEKSSIELKEKLEELTREFSNLKIEKEKESEAKESLVNEVKQLNDLLIQEGNQNQNKISELNNQINILEDEKKHLERDINDLRTKATFEVDKLDKDKEEQVKHFEKQLNDVQSQYSAETQQLREKLRVEVAAKSKLEEEKRNFEMQIRTLTSQLSDKERLLHQTQQNVDSLKADNQSIKEKSKLEIEDLRKQSQSLTTEKSNLEREIQQLSSKTKELEVQSEKISTLQKEIEDQKKAFEEKLKSEKNAFNAQLEEKKNQISELESQKLAVSSQLTELDVQLKSSQSKLKSSALLINDVEEVKGRYEQEIETLNLKLADQSKASKQELEKMQATVSELTKQKDALQSQLTNLNKNEDEKFQALQKDYSQILSEKEKFSKTLNDLQSQLQTTKTNLEAERKNVIALEEKNNDTTNELDILRQQLQQIDTKNLDNNTNRAELELQLSSLKSELETVRYKLQQEISTNQLLQSKLAASAAQPEVRGASATISGSKAPPPPPAPSPITPPPPPPPSGLAPPPPPSGAPSNQSSKPSPAMGGSNALLEQIKNPGTKLRHVTEEKISPDDISKHFDDKNVLHILARALIARRGGMKEDETKETDEDAWE